MKTVLLLTNFSETSRKAIISFLKIHAGQSIDEFKFLLLNVYSCPKTGQSQMVKFDDVLEQYSKQDLAIEYKKIIETQGLDKLDIELLSRQGDLVDIVERINIDQSVDLIVMGTKGTNILRELLLGSETDRLVRLSRNPVLVIPESVDFLKPKKVVFATELKECRNKEEFEKLTDIIRSFNAELLVLNVYKDVQPPVAFFEERMKKSLTGIKHSFHYLKDDDVAKGITNFVHQNNVGLLSMVDRKVNLLSKLFRHSVTNKLASSAEIPLLIIHE